MVVWSSWKDEYSRELDSAVKARSEGNEGKARVCARRAAGIVIGEYLLQRGLPKPSSNLYELMEFFDSLADVDQRIKAVCSHFLIKVTREHDLPVNADLIEEAAWLKDSLLSGRSD